MSRRASRLTILIVLFAVVTGAVIWARPVLGTNSSTSEDAKAIEATIWRSLVVDAYALYTLDTSELHTVYVNDARGGTLDDGTVAYIQDVRKDYTLKANQLGYLDLQVAAVEYHKQMYDSYVADLRAKQSSGTLTTDEAVMLAYIDGKPMPASTPTITPPTAIAQGKPEATQAELSGYPGAKPTDAIVSGGNPAPVIEPTLPYVGPTLPPPTPLPIIPYRAPNPTLLPPDDFNITILSIEVNGDVATAVTSKSDITSQLVLVKINGEWLIAGAEGLKAGA